MRWGWSNDGYALGEGMGETGKGRVATGQSQAHPWRGERLREEEPPQLPFFDVNVSLLFPQQEIYKDEFEDGG